MDRNSDADADTGTGTDTNTNTQRDNGTDTFSELPTTKSIKSIRLK